MKTDEQNEVYRLTPKGFMYCELVLSGLITSKQFESIWKRLEKFMKKDTEAAHEKE